MKLGILEYIDTL